MKQFLVAFAVLGLLLAFPVRVRTWYLSGDHLMAVTEKLGRPLNLDRATDLNGDGIPEEIHLNDARVELWQGQYTIWSSPQEWEVQKASLGDLNLDGDPELILLVWRPWQPWPIDQVLPYGGRIAGFQNAAGMSCHIILIGWRGSSFGEVWAGSALAEPLTAIAVADLNGDGKSELAALEGSYDQPPGSRASSLTIWTWNGFGFTLLDRQPGKFDDLSLIDHDQLVYLVTVP